MTRPLTAAQKQEAKEVSSDILATGQASLFQLSQLFRTDPKSLPKRLFGVRPATKRAGHPVYNIKEAAARLVEPGYEIEEYIRGMNHTQLPPMLGKEFWNAQQARLKFEKEMGRSYDIEQVIAAISELYQTARMSMLLLADSIERQTSLTEEQRSIIKTEIDGAIDECRNKIVERFKDYGNGPGDDGSTFLDIGVISSIGPDEIGSGVFETEDIEEEDDPL